MEQLLFLQLVCVEVCITRHSHSQNIILFSKLETFLMKHTGPFPFQIRDFNFLVKPLWTIANLQKSKPSLYYINPHNPSSFLSSTHRHSFLSVHRTQKPQGYSVSSIFLHRKHSFPL
jgi:hypothetical protein